MRYIVAILAAAAVTYGAHLAFGLGSLPRPWGSLGLGTIAGVVLVAVLLVWEYRSPSEDHEERDKRLKIEEAAREEARELRRAQKRDGSWNRLIDRSAGAGATDSGATGPGATGPVAEGPGPASGEPRGDRPDAP
ncbi:hypothetical protein [uncultured Brevibacterium sp.]|uniref:hypothetical protein n=1 Tax=uncultured Brevibacterium sp. TaxID=189678 RepID=UPI0025ED90FF|nr:hypothetical protein [uncultured Brevibacterium sp.]